MAIYEATLAMLYRGQECINRFNYVSSGTASGVSGSAALAWEMGAVIIPESEPPAYPEGTLLDVLANVLVSSVVFQQLTVINLYSVTDFYQAPFVVPYTGAAAPPGLSPASAFGFRTNVVRRDVRRGTKRFTGVPEAATQDGGVIESEEYTSLNAVGAAMGEVLVYGEGVSSISFSPVICGKQRYSPATGLPDPDGSAYRYYPTEVEQLEHDAVGVAWQLYPEVRSQNSRQYGRGR